MSTIAGRLFTLFGVCAGFAFALFLLGGTARAAGGDWPMWRGDAGRTAAVPDALPDKLNLLWTRKLPPQQTAWKDEGSMKYDRSYEPVVLGDLLFIASTVNDSVMAYELATGTEKWRFYTEGPIRFAPVAGNGKVYVGSDDGCLYCLSATEGRLLWKFRAGPSDRRLIGNERFISTWPVRGGPALADGTVYFAAGVWPFMGVFVYALDAGTGSVRWMNDSTSFTFRMMPHPGAASFAGLSPQGYVTVVGNRVIVPGSRSLPAMFDRQTGAFLGYVPGNGPRVVGKGRLAFCDGQIFDVQDGTSVSIASAGRVSTPVLAGDAWYSSAGAFDARGLVLKATTAKDGLSGLEKRQLTGEVTKRWTKGVGNPWLAAGSRLIVSVKENTLQMLDTSAKGIAPPVLWQRTFEAPPSSVAAANGHLIVVSEDGAIACLGAADTKPVTYDLPVPEKLAANAWSARAGEMLKTTGVTDGYALVWGLQDGGLVEALLAQSDLYVIAVDKDPAKVDALRKRLDRAGLYGSRAAALVADPVRMRVAPYLASLIVSEDPLAAGVGQGADFVRALAGPMRPYGGVACLSLAAAQQAQFGKQVEDEHLDGYEVKQAGAYTLLVRPGALPGSADWQGQNADAGNSRCSRDTLAMAPLGVLWYGNAVSNSLILPRHGEGPVEQVVGGRLFVEGPDSLTAADVYTGRLLWTREFPKLGKYYDWPKHQSGAHTIGGNFFAVADAIYVAYGKDCFVLNPATGVVTQQLQLPLWKGEEESSDWQFLLVYGDYLIAGSHPVDNDGTLELGYQGPSSSRRLVVMDRHSGQVLWTRDAEQSFRHYGIAAGGGKVFCIDRMAPETRKVLEKAGKTGTETPRLLALDVKTGTVVWQSEQYVSAALMYSEAQDLLIAGAALRGKDGSLVWENQESMDRIWGGKWGPLLHSRMIITQGNNAFDLATGQQRTVMTDRGQEAPWRFSKSHGCGPIVASENLVTFRSGSAGFCDLLRDGGTGGFGGFRSGCTPNLIVADGVLNAPDYSRDCVCGYQNRSSLALVTMDDVEYWTYSAEQAPGRVGFNLGAPGDRRADSGTLWRATPNRVDEMAKDGTLWWGRDTSNSTYVGEVLAETTPAKPATFYHHSSIMQGGNGLPWVGSSGMTGLQAVKVPLPGIDTKKELTLRLFFSEPDYAEAGKRVFSVALDGKPLIADLDIVKEAGGMYRTLVKEFTGIRYSGARTAEGLPALELTFTPKAGEPLLCGVEVVE